MPSTVHGVASIGACGGAASVGACGGAASFGALVGAARRCARRLKALAAARATHCVLRHALHGVAYYMLHATCLAAAL